MLTPSLAPTLPQQSSQLSRPIIAQQVLVGGSGFRPPVEVLTLPCSEAQPRLSEQVAQAARATGYPYRHDGRNFGFRSTTFSELYQFWQLYVKSWDVKTFKKCVTLTALTLELKFNERSSLLLAQSLKGLSATTQNLPKSVPLTPVCEFLEREIKGWFVFFAGDNWNPPPLAKIESPIQVDIIMPAKGPHDLFHLFLSFSDGP